MRSIAAFLMCVALAATVAGCKQGGTAGVTQDDMSLGNPNAKVTVTEYASLGCPICAAWDVTNFATFKANDIDTGKVHYVLREMSFGDSSVAAAGFLLARCAGKDKYFDVVDEVFHQVAPYLEKDGAGPALRQGLLNVAKSAGMTDDQFNACVSDDKALLAFNDRAERNRVNNHIDGTPTFAVNGRQLPSGDLPLADLQKAIDAAAASPAS